MEPYKVLVVDDSAFMRKIISDLIESDRAFRVTATASNGREAIDKVRELRPDLVTMDVEMPEMNGLEALKAIMDSSPVPVIMLSGINEQGMKETIMALEWGAFDFIRKPSVSNSQDIIAVGEALREQMNEAMQARKRRESRIRESAAAAAVPPVPAPPQTALPRQLEPAPSEEPKRPPAVEPAEPRLPAQAFRSGEEAGKRLTPVPPAKPPVKREPRKPDPVPSRKTDKPEGTGAAPAAEKRSKPYVSGTGQGAGRPVGRLSDSIVVQPAAEAPPLKGRSGHKAEVSAVSKLVAVGCSTGGPRALKALLENIPADFPAPIVIVQHMPPNFTKSLAQRLNSFCRLEVTEAEQGMVLKAGTAYIAPGGMHMKVAALPSGQLTVDLDGGLPRNGHRPSVDTLFESLLPLSSLRRYAILMTGMGSDGARMMKALNDAGVTETFAESEETCVVYGMPRSAVELQCVKHILPLQEIAPRLVQVVK